MKRNVNDTLAAISLLLTLTGFTFGQSLPQPLMPNSEKAKDERYVGHLVWPQLIPRLREASSVEDGNDGGSVVYAADAGSEFDAESNRAERRRQTKRYKLSFYDCIALYCQGANGDDRNNCILNSCNRSRSWPRK